MVIMAESLSRSVEKYRVSSACLTRAVDTVGSASLLQNAMAECTQVLSPSLSLERITLNDAIHLILTRLRYSQPVDRDLVDNIATRLIALLPLDINPQELKLVQQLNLNTKTEKQLCACLQRVSYWQLQLFLNTDRINHVVSK